jgi:hypothetical protein
LLNGSTAYVSVPNSPAWAFGRQDFTIALWTKFSVILSEQTFLAGDDGGGNHNKWIFQFVRGHLQFKLDGATNGSLASSYCGPVLDQWYHIALTRNGNNFTFYLDGSPLSSVTWIGEIPATTAPLTIGSAEGGTFFKGQLDDIRIYNRSLSPTEIKVSSNP